MTEVGSIAQVGTERDAIHIAVIPAICGEEWLAPGSWIKLVNGKAFRSSKLELVVDPFLPCSVIKEQRFYAFLRPGLVTEMQHVWKSPIVDAPTKKPVDPSIVYKIAAKCRVSYEELIEIARRKAINGTYTNDNAKRYRDVTDSEWAEFWKVFEELTGVDASDEDWAPFTCSC